MRVLLLSPRPSKQADQSENYCNFLYDFLFNCHFGTQSLNYFLFFSFSNSISNNQIGPQGASAIAALIESNKFLQVLMYFLLSSFSVFFLLFFFLLFVVITKKSDFGCESLKKRKTFFWFVVVSFFFLSTILENCGKFLPCDFIKIISV